MNGQRVTRSAFFSILEDYIGCNLPGYYWRGFAGGKWIADVNLRREDLSVSKEITIAENWEELLTKSRSVYFIHTEYKNKDSLPYTLKDGYSSFEETEAKQSVDKQRFLNPEGSLYYYPL